MHTYIRKTNFRNRITALTAALLLLGGLLPFSASRAENAEIQTQQSGSVTAECTITFPEGLSGKEYRVTDGLVETYQSFKKNDSVQVDLPEGAQGLYLQWYDTTTLYTVSQYDAAGTALSEESARPYINAYYPLVNGAVRVVVTMLEKTTLSTLAVYGAGDLPRDVQVWNPSGQGDLLIVASTSVTALDDFFGVIATYACNHDISTSLTVMSRGTRSAQEELLAALWHVGYEVYPYFAGFSSVNDIYYNQVRNDWGRRPTLDYLKAVVASASPKVLVTQPDDETAFDGAAQFTGEYTLRATEDAGVQKIYFVSGGGSTTLDFSAPLNGMAGKSVLELAADAFLLCPTRHVYETELIPASTFLLSESQVGEDAAGNNLFENIDTASLPGYVDPTPTPQPTAEPTPVPTPEPSTEPVQETASQIPQESAGDAPATAQPPLLFLGGLAAAGLILSIFLLLGYGLKKRRGVRRSKAVALSLLPFVLCLIAAGGLYFYSRTNTSSPETAAETPVPTPTATGIPTLEPTLEPTPEPEPSAAPESEPRAASASDEYYRAEGDPEEVIITDTENGHWEYRTDTLSILIDRVETEYVNYGGKTYPLVYFVAHIRMRDVNSFGTVQAAANRNGAGAIKPWVLARRSGSVLMITGDNLVESDTQYKSILIREGKVFLNSVKCDVLAMYPDMTMRIFSPGETNAYELLMDGVRDAFSFGPTLIRNGSITDEDIDHTRRIGNETNPRTGIGMVEPGHFVAIVADGRQKEYSYGMRLTAFRELFVEQGCVEAYNLDGGVSACMLFMGEQLNRHGNTHVGTIEDTYQRRIPDGLVWGFSEQVPSEDDPIYNRGEG